MSHHPAIVDRQELTEKLAAAGFVSAPEEADQLITFADGDEQLLDWTVERRLTGEPLAWIVRHTTFCGHRIGIDPGVYVPRWQSELLAERAITRLPERGGVAVELCAGAGAIAIALQAARSNARVVASEIDPVAAECARTNGVEVYEGDLFAPLPADLRGTLDVVVGVVPYVPTPELPTLQRDTFAFETKLPYDGGPEGTDVLRRVIEDAPAWLKPGGALLLELGGDQPDLLRKHLRANGFTETTVFTDEDGDVRGIETDLERRPNPS